MRLSFKLQAALPGQNKNEPYPPIILIRCAEMSPEEVGLVGNTLDRGIVNIALSPKILADILQRASDKWQQVAADA